jgi:protein involved in polysaccharide export with SLBB domain
MLMLKLKIIFRGARMRASLLVLAVAFGAGPAVAQTVARPDSLDMEPKISLSAESILEILRREPGLRLAVKRLLVRKAYEQGRLLDPADLSDDALYQLLRDDDNARVLATEEIEQREYIRAKPTREEMERDKIRRLPESDAEKTPASGAAVAIGNSEEKYWQLHEQLAALKKPLPLRPDSAVDDGFAEDGFSQDGSAEDRAAEGGAADHEDGQPRRLGPAPAPAQPRPYAPEDQRRRQSMAGLEMQNRGSYNAAPDAGYPQPLTGIPGLSSASMEESGARSGLRPGVGDDSAMLYGLPSSTSAVNPDFGIEPRQLEGGNNSANNPLTARLENRIPRPFPDPQEPDDRPVIHHHANPYAGVPSLYDLYSQVSRHAPALERFGEAVFRNGTGNFDELPMDLPVGPDYVLGPGDGLSIELWGGVSQHLQRVVDREGRVSLPEAGAVNVTGRSLGEVQQMVQSVLRGEFRDVHADISLARLRTVRVYVVGDVERPGAYDVSSLSTPLNALYQAGGPTARGSLRILRHYRGSQLVGEIDLYDLLLHGVRANLERLCAGDTIMVPPLGAELTVEGMVRRPAIYELNHESNLAEALELAGGVLNTGTLRHIDVERVVAHQGRSMLRIDLPENHLPASNLPESNNQESATKALEDFRIQDGDKIRISPLLPYSEQTVYLDGHVFHPGKHAYRDGMRVTDLVHSYADLLPEPAARHAEIIRLNPPDYTPQVIAFNLGDALAAPTEATASDSSIPHNQQDVMLKPFDTVRIFGRYDFEDPPTITISGEVRHPGEHITNGVTRLRDAVYLAGGVTRDAQLDDAQIFRRTADGKLQVLSVNLEHALAGDRAENLPLEPKDRVFIHRSLAKVDPPTVRIEGEVARPGKYPLGKDMSAAQLVRLAGGLKRGAFTEGADLTRYTLEAGTQVVGEHVAVPIGRALSGDSDTDLRLHDGDVLTIRQVAGWTDVGAVISVKGEVMHPGDYGLEEGERLSSILKRAGGLRADAYPYGAILERRQVREIEENNRAELIRQVQAQESSFKLIPADGDPDAKIAKDATLQQWHATLDELRSVPPAGRLVIHISKNVAKWANTPADLEVRAGDTLLIPKAPNYVMINGQVYNPTAITYRPGKSAGWYLRQAGGATALANRKAIFVIRADGSVVGGKGGGEWFTGDVSHAELRPGDMVFVPEKALGGTPNWKNALEAAQVVSSVAIAVSVAHGF